MKDEVKFQERKRLSKSYERDSDGYGYFIINGGGYDSEYMKG